MLPSEIQDERVRMLFSDLKSLFKLTFSHRSPLTEGDIRLASAILRRWICEGLLGKLCNDHKVLPTFPVFDTSKVFAAINADASITYFLTGGIRFDGRPVMGIYNSSKEASQEPLLPIDKMKQITLKLGKFSKQKRVFFEGTSFSCEEVILFMANKLGGVHFDQKKDDRQQKLERASNYMTFGGPLEKMPGKPKGELYLALEPEGREFLSGLHIEIVAAATSLLQIQINGEPLIELITKKTIWSRISNLFQKAPLISLYDSVSKPLPQPIRILTSAPLILAGVTSVMK